MEQVLTRLNNKYIPNFLFFYREYISRAGGKISPETRLEISPLLSYAGEHLNEKAAGQIFDQPTVILNWSWFFLDFFITTYFKCQNISHMYQLSKLFYALETLQFFTNSYEIFFFIIQKCTLQKFLKYLLVHKSWFWEVQNSGSSILVFFQHYLVLKNQAFTYPTYFYIVPISVRFGFHKYIHPK